MGEINVTSSEDGMKTFIQVGSDKNNSDSEPKKVDQIKEQVEIKQSQPKPEPKPTYIDFQKIKKINFKDNLDLENDILLGIKKNNLEYQFHVLEEQTKKKKNIFEENIDKNIVYNNKKVLQEGCCCCTMETYLSWNFKFLGPLFVIFHLVGVFQLVNLLEATQKEMIFGFKSFFKENFNRTNQNMTFNNSTDINYQFENLCFSKIPDFNLLFLSSIIGNLFLQGLGYKLSSVIFIAINSIVILIYNSFDFPEEKYDNIYSVIYILLYYIFLYISVGSMALFSQQIYFDGLKKYFEVIDDDKSLMKNKSYFTYLCFTAFPSYFIFIGLSYCFKDKYYENFFIINIYIYSVAHGLSVIIYFIYSFAFIKGEKILKNNVSKKICRICGFLIYSEKIELKSIKPNINKIEEINEKNDYNNLSENIIENDEKNVIEEKNSIKDNEIIKIKKEDIKFKVGIDNKVISVNNNHFTVNINNGNNIYFINNEEPIYFQDDTCCLSCKLGCRKFFKSIKKSDILSCIFLCNITKSYYGSSFCCPENCARELPECLSNKLCKCENCLCECCGDFWYECCGCCYCCDECCHCSCECCNIWEAIWICLFTVIFFPLCICGYCDSCCDRNDINELYQDNEEFCYCYRTQNKISWCCELLFKNDVLEIIIINIILESLTFGFGKIISDNLQNNLNINSLGQNFIIISIYLVYYIIIIFFNRIKCFDKDNDDNDTQNNQNDEKNKNKYTQYVYELFGVTIWNSFIVTIFSGFSAFGTGQFKEITDTYLILLPYALTKFYYFILVNSLVKKMDASNLDLLSNSMIISLFLSIFKIISSILIDMIEIKILLLFQFIFGLIVSLYILSVIIYHCWLVSFITKSLYNALSKNN